MKILASKINLVLHRQSNWKTNPGKLKSFLKSIRVRWTMKMIFLPRLLNKIFNSKVHRGITFSVKNLWESFITCCHMHWDRSFSAFSSQMIFGLITQNALKLRFCPFCMNKVEGFSMNTPVWYFKGQIKKSVQLRWKLSVEMLKKLLEQSTQLSCRENIFCLLAKVIKLNVP